jgi:hypothetical protein
MDCPVCLEDEIDEVKMHYTECLHHICDDCYYKLLSNSCPICRREITLSFNNNTKYNTTDDMFFENEPFVINKKRYEKKREKKRKKKEFLEKNLVQLQQVPTTIVNSYLLHIPNKKKRLYNKLNRYIVFF